MKISACWIQIWIGDLKWQAKPNKGATCMHVAGTST